MPEAKASSYLAQEAGVNSSNSNPPLDTYIPPPHNKWQNTDRIVLADHQLRSHGLPRVEIDVRPALDTPQAFVARAQRIVMDLFPGITKELQKLQAAYS
jgi:hypothetical protein